MMRLQKLVAVAGVGLVGAVAGVGGLAWACTAQLGTEVSPGAVPPGGAVNVQGEGAPGPVEIRWDGVDGPVIGEAPDGRSFAVGVRLPAAEPGFYTIVAVSRGADGRVTTTGKAPVELTGPRRTAPRGASADLWSGFESAGDAARPTVTTSPSSSSGPSAQMIVGLGLLGAGLAAGLGAAAVAEVRRRRALA